METIDIVFNVHVTDKEKAKILEDIEHYIHEHYSDEINCTEPSK